MADNQEVFRGRPWMRRSMMLAVVAIASVPVAVAVALSEATLLVHAAAFAPLLAAAVLVAVWPARARLVLEGEALAVRSPSPPHPRLELALSSIESLELRPAPPRWLASDRAVAHGLYAHAAGARRLLFASGDPDEVLACGRAVVGAARAWRAQGGALHPRLQATLERLGAQAPTEADFAIDLSRPALALTPRRPPAPWEGLRVGNLLLLALAVSQAIACLLLLLTRSEASVVASGLMMAGGALAGILFVGSFPRGRGFSADDMLQPMRGLAPTGLHALADKQAGEVVLVAGRAAALDPTIPALLGRQQVVLTLVNTLQLPPRLVGPHWTELEMEPKVAQPRAVFTVDDGERRVEIDVSGARIALPSTALNRRPTVNTRGTYDSPLDYFGDRWRARRLPERYDAVGPMPWDARRSGAFARGRAVDDPESTPVTGRVADFNPHYLDEWALAEGDAIAVLGTIQHLPIDEAGAAASGRLRAPGTARRIVIKAQVVGPA